MYLRYFSLNLVGVLTLLVSLIGPATAIEHPCASRTVSQGKITDGSTIILFQVDGDDRRFKLEGVLFPQGGIGFSQVGEILLHAVTIEPDRYGRIAVQAFTAGDGEWLQGRLLRNGDVFQYALNVEASCLNAMRQAEAAARRAKSGIWNGEAPLFASNNTDVLLQHSGKFSIIEGIVQSVGDRKTRLYLNFGSNWSEDVTAVVTKKGSGAFRGDVAVLRQLKGRRIQIRGIVENAQGPLIRLIDEAQIDILDR